MARRAPNRQRRSKRQARLQWLRRKVRLYEWPSPPRNLIVCDRVTDQGNLAARCGPPHASRRSARLQSSRIVLGALEIVNGVLDTAVMQVDDSPDSQTEPRRESRRLRGVSYAAMGNSESVLK
jgi:hypothetical protein